MQIDIILEIWPIVSSVANYPPPPVMASKLVIQAVMVFLVVA